MTFRKLFYCGLESYQSRYTFQLQDWSEKVFKERGIEYAIVPGETIDNSKAIQVGQVLDAHGRSYFAMSQMMNLVQMLRNGEITGEDAIFFEDMFQPGIESLPYILDQIPEKDRPKIWVRCLAQSIDPDDFIHVCGMEKWMSHYEALVNEFATGILASSEEMVAHMKIANWKAPIYNISGLAFGKDEVQSRVEHIKDWYSRENRIVFAARFDQEKQPDFFMDIIENWHIWSKIKTKFVVLTGSSLKSNNMKYVERAKELQDRELLEIEENLTKNEYYEILNNSKVLFNCALQDWISNTVSEADTLGCNVIYPAYRSFPEVFANCEERMYIPWSQVDAIKKLEEALHTPHRNIGKISDWTNKTIDRCIDIMQGKGEQWRRDGIRYRNKLAERKY